MIEIAFVLAPSLAQDRGPEPTAVLKGHVGPVTSLAYKDAKILLSGSLDQTVRIWDVASARELTALKGQQAVPYVGGAKPGLGDPGVTQIALDPSGTIVAATRQDGAITLWDIASRRKTRDLRGGLGLITFLPDGTTLAHAGPGSLGWWNASTGDPRTAFKLPEEEGGYGFLSSDGKICATIDLKGRIVLREPSTGKAARTLAAGARGVRGASPDGTLLVIDPTDRGDGSRSIEILEVASGKTRELIRWTPESRPFGHVKIAFSPDGSLVACSASLSVNGKPSPHGSVAVWRVATSEKILSIASDDDACLGVAFAPDGMSVAAGTGEGLIRIWNIPKPRLKAVPSADKK